MDKDNKCGICDGTGICPDFLNTPYHKEIYGDKCTSCDGSGFSTRWKDSIICPYCGHEENDSWEAANDSRDHECYSCGKHFQYDSETKREFSSWRVDCLNDESLHEWKENKWYSDKRRDGKMYADCKKCRQSKWVQIVEQGIK